MHIHKLILLTFSIISLTLPHQVKAQTIYIRTMTPDHGSVYTQVYEYDYVEEKPEFPGGGSSLINFINTNRHYPSEAYDMGIEGRVTCSFVVHEDGKITHIKVLRGVEQSLNREAIRLVSMMPDWIPGKIKEHPVPVRVVCCIPFRK